MATHGSMRARRERLRTWLRPCSPSGSARVEPAYALRALHSPPSTCPIKRMREGERARAARPDEEARAAVAAAKLGDDVERQEREVLVDEGERADEKLDERQWERFQRRLEQQKAEASRAREGRTGAASAVRRLDPATGEVIEVLAKTKVRFDVPKVARGEAERGDKHALAVLARAGRDGAPAAWLADTRVAGEAKGISLVKRGWRW